MSQWDGLVQAASQKYNVDPKLIASVIQVESGGNPDAYNASTGGTGLGQQIPATAKALGVNPSDPASSIDGIGKLLNENLNRYGTPEKAILAYHGGTDQSAWGPKTQDYLNKVTTQYGAPAVAKQAAAPNTDFEAAFGARPGAAPSTAANSAPAVDPFEAAFGARPTAAQSPSDVPSVPAPSGGTQQATTQSGGIPSPLDVGRAVTDYAVKNTVGAVNGVQDALDAPAEWLAKGLDKSGITGLLAKAGINSGTYDQQVQADKDRRAAYDAQYGGSFAAGAGRLGGQALATVLPVGGAQAALAKGGNVLLDAMRASPSLAGAVPATTAVGNLLSGAGGLASKATNLGLQGAGGAALLSGGSDTPLAEQMGTGALLGAAIPIAGKAIGSAIGTGKNAISAITSPFSDTGRQGLAESLVSREAQAADQAALKAAPAPNPVAQAEPTPAPAGSPEAATQAMQAGPQDALNAAAKGGNQTANFDEIIPGSKPTLAQATGNAGIAALERAAQSRAPNAFNELQQQNNSARSDFFNNLRGNPETLQNAIDEREQTALPMLKDALTGAGDADSSPVMSTIRGILGSEAGQRDAVKSAMKPIIAKLDIGAVTTKDPLIPGSQQRVDPNGSGLQYNVNQLYGIRKSINDQLENVSGRDNSSAQQASRELIQVRDSLDDAIQQAAPGFKEYLNSYSTLSRPIEAQRYLQNLDLTNAGSQQMTLSKVKSAITKIDRAQQQPGANAAKSITDDQYNGLKALQADLQRESNSNLGMGRGSNTFQNLATNQLIEALGSGGVMRAAAPSSLGAGLGYLAGGPVGAAMGGTVGGTIGNMVGNAMRNQAPDVEAKLINLLLNPEGAAYLRGAQSGVAPAADNALLQRGVVQGGAAVAAPSVPTGRKNR